MGRGDDEQSEVRSEPCSDTTEVTAVAPSTSLTRVSTPSGHVATIKLSQHLPNLLTAIISRLELQSATNISL